MADTSSQRQDTYWTALAVSVVLVAGLRLLSPFIPIDRLWGLDYIQYIPLWITWVTTAIMALLLIPAIRHNIIDWYEELDEKRLRSVYLVTSVLVGLVIILFPMETFLLGDGGLFIGEVFKAVQTEGFVSTRLLDLKSAPLEGVVLYAITYTLPSIAQSLGLESAFQPVFPFRVVALVAYIVAVIAIYRLQKPKYRLPVLLFMLGTAGSLLYFGYVEMYAFVFVAMAINALTATSYLQGRVGKRTVVVVYVILLLSHYYTVSLLPSLLYLLFKDKLPEERITVRNAILAVVAGVGLVTILYFVTGLYGYDNRIVIPLVNIMTDTGLNTYTLLSSIHLLDLLNLLFLLAPVPLVFLLIYRRKDASERDTKTAVFYILSGGFFMGFLLYANTVYGLGRDWDLAAPLGVLIALGAFHAVTSAKNHPAAKAFVFSLLTVVYVVPWLTVNINLEGSKNRMGYLVELEVDNILPYLSMIGYEALRKQYLHEKNYDRELEYLIKMVRLQDHPDSYNLLESTLFTNYFNDKDTIVKYNKWMIHRLDSLAGKLQAGQFVYKWQSEKFVDSMVAGIGYYAYLNQRIEPMQEQISSFVEQRKLNTVLLVLNGMEAYRKSNFQDAAFYLGRAAQNDFMTGKLAGMHGDALMQTGQPERSDSVFAAAFKTYPDDTELRLIRAFSLIQKGVRPEEARQYLLEARAMYPDDAMSRTIDALMNRLPSKE